MVTNDKFRDYISKFKEKMISPEKMGDCSSTLSPSELANLAYTDAAQKNKKTPKKNKKKAEQNQVEHAGNYDFTELKNEEKWIKSHSISYTFNKDEFLPNPDSKIWFQKNCKYEDYQNYPLDIL